LIVHLQYTARNGGARFRDVVQSELSQALNSMLVAQGKNGLYRYFSAKQEFPNEWHQFLHAPLGTDGQAMSLPLTLERFPYPLRNKGIHIRELQIYLLLKAVPEAYAEHPLLLRVIPAGDGEQKALGIGSQTELENVPRATWDYGDSGVEVTDHTHWSVTAPIPVDEEGNPIDNYPLIVQEEGEGETIIRRLDAGQIEDMGFLCHYGIAAE